MAAHKMQDIQIADLLLDVQNPRHDIVTKQTETLAEIILNQKSKLLKLAKDIMDFGINPSELTIAIPCAEENGKYIVVEGNRRLAAIQLLSDPTLAALGYDTKDCNTFKRYSEAYNKATLDKLSCVVFPKREDANHWIELRHTGENEGKGIVPWGAKETARFNVLLGKPSKALQVLEFVKKNANLTTTEKDALKTPNLTSIQRLVGDPNVREALGIDVTDGYVTANLPPEAIINGMTKLVMDVATQKISVDNIRHKKDRADYITEFTQDYLPDPAAKAVATWKIEDQKESVKPPATSGGTHSGAAGKKSVPLSTSRLTLYTFQLRSKDKDVSAT